MNQARRIMTMNNSNSEIIGVDHGWSQMKTPNAPVFSAGVRKLSTEPAVYDEILEYKEVFYRIGTVRETVMENKIQTEDYYLLTLAAIAKELHIRGKTEANVVLSVGLPASRYGDEKQEFIKYLSKNKEVSFVFEQRQYNIKIVKVAVFPQGYAAVVDKINTFGQKVVIVDVGSWTVDIIPIINRKPDDSGFNSLPEGLIPCMRKINQICIRKYNEKIDEMDIQQYIINRKTDLGEEFVAIMDEVLTDFATRLYNSLREEGYSLKTTQFVFVGGGACVIKNFGGYELRNINYNLDIKANAKGFEKLAQIALAARR